MSGPQILDENCMADFPWLKLDANKHTRGRLGIFSGNEFETGAARLAAIAGARIGAGWVKIFAPIEAARIIASQITSIMVGAYRHGDILPAELSGFNCVVIGMAFGDSAANIATIDRLVASDLPLVIDADAINIIAQNQEEFAPKLCARNAPIILTPHAGEFARLAKKSPSKDIHERANQAFEIANKLSAVVVLKGEKTIIAANQNGAKSIFINQDSTPWLASAGSGDVLAGLIGGLIAQGANPMNAAKIAVYLHSQMAIRIGAGLMAEDIAANIGQLINEFAPERLKSRGNKFSKT